MLLVFDCGETHLNAAPPELNWEQANARRMFVLTNDGQRIAAIVVDTTHPDHLRAAVRLQELVFRIGAARLPIVDRQFVRVPWGKIHLAWDDYPMRPRKHPYTIEMKQADSTSANPPKQIIISGAPPAKLEAAVSAFTAAAFGIPLNALDDKKYQWRSTKTLAIAEDFGPIRPAWPNRKAGK